MIALAVAWYLQDFMQVLLTTAFLAPELFFIVLTGFTARRHWTSPAWYGLTVLVGLFYDLRWSGLPGLCAALYLAGLWVFREVWFHRIPRDGHNRVSFVVLNAILTLVMMLVRLFFWRGSGSLGHMFWGFVFSYALTFVPLWLLSLMRIFDDETVHF